MARFKLNIIEKHYIQYLDGKPDALTFAPPTQIFEVEAITIQEAKQKALLKYPAFDSIGYRINVEVLEITQ